MKNKYFPDEEIELDDLYFTCYMIERVARRLHQTTRYVVNAIGSDALYHILSLASVLHCENPERVEHDWIENYNLITGEVDITDGDVADIPTPLDMGAIYQRLIVDTMSPEENYVDGILRIYNALSDKEVKEDSEKI